MRKLLATLLACLAMQAGAYAGASLDSRQLPEFHFAVMGDNRPFWNAEDVVTQNEHFMANIERTNASGADFAVIVGDLIHGYTDDTDLIERQWDAYDDAIRRFTVPLYSVAGNHDIWNEKSKRIWLQRRGPLYFSWSHKGCHFIALNSEIPGQMDRIAGEQLEWLRHELEKARSARRIFVFVHKPLWTLKPEGPGEQNQWMREVHPLLARHGVDTVFAGHHHHYLLYPPLDGVRYVVTGGAGAEIGPYRLAGDFFHVLDVTVRGRSSEFRILTAEGSLPPDSVTTQKVAALHRMLSVEPLRRLPEEGPLEIALRVSNPTDREARAVVTWDTRGTTWRAEQQQAPVPAGGQAALTVSAYPGERLFPLPKARVELVREQAKLFGWEFLPRAFVEVGRFVTQWNVVGPFDLGYRDRTAAERADAKRFTSMPRKGWDEPLPPEEKVDLAGIYTGKGGRTVHWQLVRAGADGVVDLDALYAREDYAVACAVCYVFAPAAGRYQMTIGSDDSVLVRINGEEAWRFDGQRAATPDSDAFEADLRRGWNEVLLKVADRRGGWGFCLRVVDPGGTLRFSAAPPAAARAAPRW